MKVRHIKELIAGMEDEAEIAVIWYDKSDAESFIEDQSVEEETTIPQVTDEEWQLVVRLMDKDDSVWNEIYESFKYAMEKMLENRKG